MKTDLVVHYIIVVRPNEALRFGCCKPKVTNSKTLFSSLLESLTGLHDWLGIKLRVTGLIYRGNIAACQKTRMYDFVP